MGQKLKKMLTLEDLVEFCEQSQLQAFNAQDEGYELCVQIPATLTFDEEQKDDTLLYTRVKVCHTLLNRNGSYISTANMETAMPTLKYKPLLANFVTYEEDGKSITDFTSHDMEINEDGTVNYIERQVGAFTADEPFLEYDEEYDKTYVIAYCAIPKDYTEAANIIERKNGTKVSCELSIRDMAYNAQEHRLELTNFVFTGVTCLGVHVNGDKVTEVGEGMLGSRADITDFSQSKNSIVSHMDTNAKLIESLDKLNNTLSNFNIQGQNNAEFLEKGGNVSMEGAEENMQTNVEQTENFEATTEQSDENTTTDSSVSTTVVETEATTEGVAETEDKTSTEFNQEGVQTETEASQQMQKYTISNGEVEYTFEISLNDKINALWELVNTTYSEADNTYYGVDAYDSYVVMKDYWNSRYYKQNYTVDNNNFILTGDRVEVYTEYLTADEQTKLADIRANYEATVEKLNKYETAELLSQKEAVFADVAYADYIETEEFAALKKNQDSYSVEELKTACDLAFAKLVKAKTFSAVENTVEKPKKSKVTFDINSTEKVDDSPYGDLFNGI